MAVYPDTNRTGWNLQNRIVYEDIAGNKISKEASFTIDTIVSDPSIDLLDADDTGESAVDNITSVTKPSLCYWQCKSPILILVVIRINGVSYPLRQMAITFRGICVPVALNDGVYEAVVVFRYCRKYF